MLVKILRILGVVLLCLLLTAITQVGGVVLLVTLVVGRFVKKNVNNAIFRRLVNPLLFIVFYALTVIVIVPPVARYFGREVLPWRGNLQPLTLWTCLANRNYVTPTLKEMVMEATDEFLKEHPQRKVNYLDANFPFIDKFPLWPHLSHNDGKKLDVAFFYTDKNGHVISGAPSPIGYGVCEGPQAGEENYPERCSKKGFWQYSLLEKVVPQGKKPAYHFDAEATAGFVKLLVNDKRTQKLFIEPHLKVRLKLKSSKIRFHGCQAVRHDDHIHVQVK